MAQQLTAAGQPVGLLVLFDTFSPLLQLKEMNIRSSLARFRAEGSSYLRRVVERHLGLLRTRRDERSLDDLLARGAPVPAGLRELHLTRAFTAAIAGYQVRPWGGPALLFSAQDVAWVFSGSGPAYGWDRLIAKLEVRRAEGDHATLLLEPQVGAVVSALNEAFARCADLHLHRIA
jgi:thioesterase domain-containing protein